MDIKDINVDVQLLELQRNTLFGLINNPYLTAEEVISIEGLINFLNYILDELDPIDAPITTPLPKVDNEKFNEEHIVGYPYNADH